MHLTRSIRCIFHSDGMFATHNRLQTSRKTHNIN